VNAGTNEPAVHYRRISDPSLRAVAGTQGAAGVALSADGETLLYRRDGHLWTSALDGGKAKRLAPVSGSMPEDAFWNPPDGMIYYTAPGRRPAILCRAQFGECRRTGHGRPSR
jgi:hypothetical protein